MSSKRRPTGRAQARRPAARGQAIGRSSASRKQEPIRRGQPPSRFAKTWNSLSANPLVLATVTAAFSVVAGFLAGNFLHQGAANEAAVEAQKDAARAALRQDAELVNFGLGTASHDSSPQIVIENSSSGWVRNITLSVPVPTRTTPNADGTADVSLPNLKIDPDGASGFYGYEIVNGVAYFREPLPDIGPCELAVTTALKSVSTLDITNLAKSELYFTDPNGLAWERSGSGKLARNAKSSTPDTWQPYILLEPVPGCSPG